MSVYEFLYAPKYVSPVKMLEEQRQGWKSEADQGNVELQGRLKYSTKDELFAPVVAPNSFLERPGIVFRDFSFKNQLMALDKDPLCLPQTDQMYQDLELSTAIKKLDRPFTN